MVSVEPPETMRPWRTNCQPARPTAQRVDAVMRLEALVLVGDQHGEVARVDVLGIDRQAPAPVRRREGPQQPVVAIDHRDRKRLGAGQRQGLHALPDGAEHANAAADEESRGKQRASRNAQCFRAPCGRRRANPLSPLFRGERVRVRGSRLLRRM